MARAGWLVPAVISAVVIAQGIHGVSLLMGEHGDSGDILYDSVPAILHGHYHRSRALGVPLYEAIAALLVWLGGIRLVNLCSLLLAVGSVFVFDHLLDRTVPPTRRVLVLCAFALNPIFLTNSTVPIEWMLALFLILCQLAAAIAYASTRSMPALIAYAFANMGCVLTRPDLVWLCAPVFLALLWETGWNRTAVIQAAAANLVGAAVVAGVYLSINPLQELETAVTFDGGTLARRLMLAGGGAIGLFGLLGICAALVLVINILQRIRQTGLNATSLPAKLFLLSAPILIARFIILPTKIEYLFPMLVIFLLAVAYEARQTLALGVMAASLVLGSVVQLSLLERQGTSDVFHLRPHIAPGAIAQDWQRRQQNADQRDPRYLDAIADAVYRPAGQAVEALHMVKFFPGLVSEGGDLIVGAPDLYRFDNPRFDPPMRRNDYRRVYVCDKSVAMANEGWRVLQAPEPIARFDRASGQVDTRCRPENGGGK